MTHHPNSGPVRSRSFGAGLTLCLTLLVSPALVGCGSSDSQESAGGAVVETSVGATADEATSASIAETATAESASTEGSAAAASGPIGTGLDGEPIDCTDTEIRLQDLKRYLSIVARFAKPQPGETVEQWQAIAAPFEVGGMSDTVSILRSRISAYDSESLASFNSLEDGAAILDRGLGGDASAMAEIKTWSDTNIPNMVGLLVPLSRAYEAAGCPT
jgi:hypothetical protein